MDLSILINKVKTCLGLFCVKISFSLLLSIIFLSGFLFTGNQDAYAQAYYQVGTNDGAVGGGQPSPNSTWYKSRRLQWIYTAAELNALGVECGRIEEFAFYVVQANAIATLSNYTIKMANTNLVSFPNNIEVGESTVEVWRGGYSDQANRWNNFVLQTPFDWDGRNLMIEICWPVQGHNANSSGTVRMEDRTDGMAEAQNDSQNACNQTGSFPDDVRPIGRLFIDDSNPALNAGSLSPNGPISICEGQTTTITYNPGTTNTNTWEYSTDGVNYTNIPGSPTTSYTTSAGLNPGTYYIRVKGSISGQCGTKTTNVVQVNIAPSSIDNITIADACIGNTTTITYNGANSGTFQWQKSTDGNTWSDISGETGTTYSFTNSTSEFYRLYVDYSPCASPDYTNVVQNSAVYCLSGNQTITECQGKIADSGGPNGNYAANESYVVTIQPAGASTVTLDFSVFVTDPYTDIVNGNPVDYLNIYDGVGTGAPLISGPHYDTDNPGIATSTGGAITIEWETDGTDEFAGFLADFSATYPPVSISPATQTINYGDNASITVTGAVGTVTWEYSTNGTGGPWTTHPTLSGSSISPSPQEDTHYRAVITKNGNCVDRTTEVFVEVLTGLAEFTQDKTTICEGEQVQFTNETKGGVSVDWTFEGGTPATSTQDDPLVTYATEGTYDVTLVSHRPNGLPDDTHTETDLITVNPNPVGGTLASSQNVCVGDDVDLTLSGNKGAIEWYFSTATTPWTLIGGNTTNSLNTGALSETTSYRTKSTNSCGNEFSNTVTITVHPVVDAGTLSGPASVCSGEDAQITLTGSEGDIQFERSPNGTTGWVNVGTNTTSYTESSMTQKWFFRAQLTTTYCGNATSNVIEIDVLENANVDDIGSDQEVCSGESVTLSTSNSVGTIQWEQSTNQGTSWVSIGSNSESYTTPALTQTTLYRVHVDASPCGKDTSNVVEITVNENADAGDIDGPASVCKGNTATIDLTNSSGTIQWEDSTAGGTWTPQTAPGTATSYTTSPLFNPIFIRALITTPSCGEDTSAVWEVQVFDPPAAGSIGGDHLVCEGAELEISSNGTEGLLQWEISTNTGTTWNEINGEETDTYNTGVLAPGSFMLRLVASVDNCGEDISNEITITVEDTATAGTLSGPTHVCVGNTASLTLAGYTGTIQIQDSLPGGSWADIAGATSDSYDETNFNQNTYYRAILSTQNCGRDTTNEVFIQVVNTPDAGDIGGDINACKNEEVTLTSPTTEGSLTWEQSTNSGASWDPITGANSNSYTTPALTADIMYRLHSEVSGCGEDYSNEITITVHDNPVAGTVSGDTELCKGDFATLTVAGEFGQRQWQDSVFGGSWTDLAGETGSSLSVDPTSSFRYYRVVSKTTYCGNAFSNIHTIAVKDLPLAGDIGNDRSVCSGESIEITTTGFNGNLQWEEGSAGSFTPITGANSASYTTPSLTSEISYFVVAEVDGCGKDSSDVITVSINQNPDAGDLSGPSFVCSGSTATFTVTNEVGTIQFEDSIPGGSWKEISGANGNNFESGILTADRIFRVIVYTAKCGSDTSDAHLVEVRPNPEAGDIGDDQEICSGEDISYTSSSVAGDLQWQASTNSGGSWSDINGEEAQTITVNNLTQTTQFRLKSTVPGCGEDFSNTVEVVVHENPAVGTVTTANTEVCKGSDVDFEIGTSVGQIQWQDSTIGNSWTDIAGENANTLTIEDLTTKVFVRAVVTTDNCGFEVSNEVSVDVIELPSAGTISGTNSICSGEETTLSSDATHGDLQWQFSSNASGPWSNIANENSASHTTTSLTATTFFRLEAAVPSCGANYSNTIKVTVHELVNAGALAFSDGSTSKTICVQDNISATLSGYEGSIQFQDSAIGDVWTNISGAITDTYSESNITSNRFFRAVVTTSQCGTAISNELELEVKEAPEASTIGADVELCAGDDLTINVNGTNGDLQWQTTPDLGIWSDLPGEDQPSITLTDLQSTFYLKLKSNVPVCGNDFSNFKKVTVNPSPVAGDISGDNTICSGERTSLTIANHVGDVQWQDSTAGGSWKDVVGAEQAIFQTNFLTETSFFRVVLSTQKCGEMTTSEYEVVVNELPQASDLGGDQGACVGDDVTITAANTEGDLQWEFSTDGNTPWTPISNENAASLTRSNITITGAGYFRLVASVLNCGTAISETVRITVEDYAKAGDLTGPNQICEGLPLELELTNYSGAISYEKSTNGTNWGFMPGSTDQISFAAPSQTHFYRAKLSTENCGNAVTTPVKVTIVAPPEVGNVGGGLAACMGVDMEVETETFNGDLIWQKETSPNVWQDLSGETNPKILFPAIVNGGTYRLKATVDGCGEEISDPVVITVYETPDAGTIDAPAVFCSGQPIDVSLTGYRGLPLLQDSAKSAVFWSSIGSYGTDNHQIEDMVQTTSFRFIVLSEKCGQDTSDVVTVEYKKGPVGGFIGNDVVVCANDEAVFSAEETFGDLQWEMSGNGSMWTDIAGETSSDLTLSNFVDNDFFVRLKASVQDCGDSFSNIVHVLVKEEPKPGTLVTSVAEVCAGEPFNVELLNSVGTIQFQDSTPQGEWENVSGTLNALEINTALVTTSYRAMVSNDFCTAYSNVEEVVVHKKPLAGYIGKDRNMCPGEIDSLIAANFSGDLQWEKAVSGGSFSPIAGETSDTLYINPLTESTSFRLVASNAICEDHISNVVTLTTPSDYVAGSIVGPSEVCANETFELKRIGTVGFAQWQDSVAGGSWHDLGPAGESTISVGFLSETTFFRLEVGDPSCEQIYSAEYRVNVKEAPEAGVVAGPTHLCEGESITLETTGSTGDLIWERSIGAVNWTEIPGETAESLVVDDLSSTTFFRVRAANGNCPDDASNLIEVLYYPAADPGVVVANPKVCLGERTTIEVQGADANFILQDSVAGGSWNFAGSTPEVLTEPIFQNTFYRTKVGDANCGFEYSDEVLVRVAQEPVGGVVPEEAWFCFEGNATVSALGASGDFQWQMKVDGVWANLPGQTSATIGFSDGDQGNHYRLKAYEEGCGFDYSNEVHVNMEMPLDTGYIDGPDSLCIGAELLLKYFGDAENVLFEASTNGTTWDSVGASTIYIEPDFGTERYYRVTQLMQACENVFADTILVTPSEEAIAGTIGGGDLEVCPGEPFSFSIDNTVGDVVWQYRGEQGSWVTVPDESGATLNMPGVNVTSFFRVKVTQPGCQFGAFSNVVQVNVKLGPLAGRTIAGAKAICPGEELSLNTQFATGILQWEQSNNGIDFNAIPGATDRTFNTGALSETTYFRVVETSAECGSATSEATVVAVTPVADAGFIQESQTVCEGTSVTLEVNGANGPIQWERGLSINSFTQQVGETGTTLETPNLLSNLYYRVVVKDEVCNTADTSQVVELEVKPLPEVGTVTGDMDICSGEFANLFAENYEGVAYFQDSIPGGMWENTAGGSSANVTIGPLSTERFVRIVATLDGCSSTSVPYRVGVKQGPYAGPISAPDSVCAGKEFEVEVNGLIANNAVWQFAPNGGAWQNVNATFNPVLPIQGIQSHTAVRVIAEVEGCGSDTSVVNIGAKLCTPPVAYFEVEVEGGNAFVPNNLSENEQTWHWDFGDGSTSTEEFPTHVYQEVRVFQVCLTVTNDLTSDSYCDQVMVNALNGIAETSLEERLAVFPNPTNGVVMLSGDGLTINEVQLIDAAGRTLKVWSQVDKLDVGNYPTGMYQLKIQTDQGLVNKKLMIQD